MFRAISSRHLLFRSTIPTILIKRSVKFPPKQGDYRLFATVKIDNYTANTLKKKKKKRGDKSKPQQQQSPDVAKEREIQNLQQEIKWYHTQGEYDKGLETSQLLLSTTQNHFGKDHPATSSAYNNVGLFHKLLGNYSEATKMYHQALRSYELILGTNHESYAAALHNIGILYKTQCMLDESLSAMERLSLTEQAIEFLEQALTVRVAELGKEHPHSVASQSALGSTIASQLLAAQLQQTKDNQEYKPSKMTVQRWQAAEQHLRQALDIAIQNPRGTRLDENHAKNAYKNITTTSAAAAAQNLAVILKTRATIATPMDEDMLQEAKLLYEQALFVRTTLLHDAHPDTVATKHSLAELVAAIGDEEGANKMRQEIMDSYNITEIDDDDDHENEGEKGGS